MDEVILWEHRKALIKYICINNYSIIHARHILNNKHFKYNKNAYTKTQRSIYQNIWK